MPDSPEFSISTQSTTVLSSFPASLRSRSHSSAFSEAETFDSQGTSACASGKRTYGTKTVRMRTLNPDTVLRVFRCDFRKMGIAERIVEVGEGAVLALSAEVGNK